MHHSLVLARQRLQARFQSPSTPAPVRLAHGLVVTGKSQALPLLTSALAQEILVRGYDSRTISRILENRPAGELGPVGRIMDGIVQGLPVHSAIRERRDAAVGEIAAAAVMALRGGQAEFRVLSAPCGLGFEIRGAAAKLPERSVDVG